MRSLSLPHSLTVNYFCILKTIFLKPLNDTSKLYYDNTESNKVCCIGRILFLTLFITMRVIETNNQLLISKTC